MKNVEVKDLGVLEFNIIESILLGVLSGVILFLHLKACHVLHIKLTPIAHDYAAAYLCVVASCLAAYLLKFTYVRIDIVIAILLFVNAITIYKSLEWWLALNLNKEGRNVLVAGLTCLQLLIILKV